MINYNFFQKTLHKFVLKNHIIINSLYEVEKLFFLKNQKTIINNNHVFISALPRSGTTILLNLLYNTNEFASLTYKDMPFIMAPNLTKFLNKNKNISQINRFHEDGIKYGLDSPEAFDEIILSIVNNESFSDEYINFIYLILSKYNKKKYISKNNHNYKRFNELKKIFPKMKFLILFRDPLQHAYSLLHQHKNFSNLQNKNKFILEYMNLLSHFEFGLNHKSWFTPIKYNNFNDINYWLEQWHLFYTNILNQFEINNNLLIFSYEKMCDDFNFQKFLFKFIQLENKNDYFKFKKAIKKNIDDKIVDTKLLNKCVLLYNKLNDVIK